MKTLGEKVKELRLALDMTQEQLANQVEVTVKSIQRYENNLSRPDTHALMKLSLFFDVSADYLLGISSYEKQLGETVNKILKEGGYNYLYKTNLDSKNNYVIDEESYYFWIYADDDEIGGQTVWQGWADEDKKTEIRVLREVHPENAIHACTLTKGKPMVINSKEEAEVFMVFGGHAIIKKEICEKYLPWFMKPYLG